MSRDYSRREVLDIIVNEARERGIPRDDFLRFAYIETGGAFDESVSRGPNGAKGLFQFVPDTARQYGIAGRELDPVANTDAAARLYLANRRDIVAAHARTGHTYLSGKPQPDGLDMYMAHQQGAGGYQSIQAAIASGAFTRNDTRRNILNNVSRRDFESVTGISHERFSRMPDQDMARTFVQYWDRKFDRVQIPEMGIEPAAARSDRDVAGARNTPTAPTAGSVSLARAYKLSAQHDSVRYGLGSKSVQSGQIDCSGWVVMLQNATMNEINASVGRTVFARNELFNPGMDAAATIVQKSAQRSGLLLEGGDVRRTNLREGMVIGEDNGRTSFDAGRYRGIDHIVMVVRDPHSGELMASQSRSGEGVEMIPLDRYLQAKQARGVKLFATDPLHEARSLIEPHPTVSQGAHETAPDRRPTAGQANVHAGLRHGEKGPAVSTLQQRLADLGYRGRDGKPLEVDGDFGDNTRFAVQAFQREHGLEGLGVAGRKTATALAGAERALLSHPSHPQHALYAQVLERVQAEERAKGIAPGPHSARIAGALAVECLREGITRVDRVELNRDITLVRGVQVSALRDEPGLNITTDAISTRQAAAQPMLESTEQLQQVAANREARQLDAQQRQAAATPVLAQ